jgi:hypothetical protein
MPPALDFVEQAYVRAVATSRVGFVVIAENAEIFPPVAEGPTRSIRRTIEGGG